MEKLTFTKAISGGVLKTSQMEVGSSVRGTLKELTQGKYGTNLILVVTGRDVTVYTSGNLRNLNNNKALVPGSEVTITRKEDYKTKTGRTSTSFNLSVKEFPSDETEEAPEVAEARAKIAKLKAAKANG